MPKVAVQKNVKLQEGEELMDFVNKVMDAVSTHRQKVDRSVFLRGIFKGFIITRDFESGKFFQMKLSRAPDGLIKLGDPIEVRQAFVPVVQAAAKSEDDDSKLIELPSVTVMTKGGALTPEAIDSLQEIVKGMVGTHEDPDFVEVQKSEDVPASFADVLGLQQ